MIFSSRMVDICALWLSVVGLAGALLAGPPPLPTGLDEPAPPRMSSNLASIAAGQDHSLRILRDGTVWAWGANWIGQLGDGTTGGPLHGGPGQWHHRHRGGRRGPA